MHYFNEKMRAGMGLVVMVEPLATQQIRKSGTHGRTSATEVGKDVSVKLRQQRRSRGMQSKAARPQVPQSVLL